MGGNRKMNSFESSTRVNENKKQKKVGMGSRKIFSKSIDYAQNLFAVELYPLTVYLKEGIFLLS